MDSASTHALLQFWRHRIWYVIARRRYTWFHLRVLDLVIARGALSWDLAFQVTTTEDQFSWHYDLAIRLQQSQGAWCDIRLYKVRFAYGVGVATRILPRSMPGALRLNNHHKVAVALWEILSYSDEIITSATGARGASGQAKGSAKKQEQEGLHTVNIIPFAIQMCRRAFVFRIVHWREYNE